MASKNQFRFDRPGSRRIATDSKQRHLRIPRLLQKTKESLIPEVSTRLFFSPPPFLSTRRSIEENQSFTYLQGGKLFLPLLLRFEVMDGSLSPFARARLPRSSSLGWRRRKGGTSEIAGTGWSGVRETSESRIQQSSLSPLFRSRGRRKGSRSSRARG